MNISSCFSPKVTFSGSLGFNAYIENGKSLHESNYFYRKSTEIPGAWEIVPLNNYLQEEDSFVSSMKSEKLLNDIEEEKLHNSPKNFQNNIIIKPIEKTKNPSKHAEDYSIYPIFEDINDNKSCYKILPAMALLASLGIGVPVCHINREMNEPKTEYKATNLKTYDFENNDNQSHNIILETKSGEKFIYDWDTKTPIKLNTVKIASAENN